MPNEKNLHCRQVVKTRKQVELIINNLWYSLDMTALDKVHVIVYSTIIKNWIIV